MSPKSVHNTFRTQCFGVVNEILSNQLTVYKQLFNKFMFRNCYEINQNQFPIDKDNNLLISLFSSNKLNSETITTMTDSLV